MKNTITVTVLDVESYEEGFPASYDTPFVQFVEKMQELLSGIPEEYRDSARIHIDSESSWEDSHYASIKVEYSRPMTEEEIAESRRREAQQEANRLAQKREQLNRLKAELGEP